MMVDNLIRSKKFVRKMLKVKYKDRASKEPNNYCIRVKGEFNKKMW